MYIENKGDEQIIGFGRIGRVSFSKTGKTVYYKGMTLEKHQGFKSNYINTESGNTYWISGCKKGGNDTLYPGIIEIDDDVREEYWLQIRGIPESIKITEIRSEGKYSKRKPK
jgi:hypothetical protein